MDFRGGVVSWALLLAACGPNSDGGAGATSEGTETDSPTAGQADAGEGSGGAGSDGGAATTGSGGSDGPADASSGDEGTTGGADSAGDDDTSGADSGGTGGDGSLVAAPDFEFMDRDTTATFDVLANDAGLGVRFAPAGIVGAPSHGTATLVGGQVEYTPTPGFVGTDTLTYRVTGDAGGTDEASVRVRVSEASPPGLCGETSPSPGEMLDQINTVLRGGAPDCNWEDELNLSLGAWTNNGSQNLPVVAAALALIYRPVTDAYDIRDWWMTYLPAQLGDEGAPGHLGYFTGSEQTSYNYQYYNIEAVMVVLFEAELTGDTQLRNLARRFLRANWAVIGLSAGYHPMRTMHDRGTVDPGQVNASNQHYYDGPYVALAGARSSNNHWAATIRGELFSRAVGWAYKNVRDNGGHIKEYVEDNWPGPGPHNAYGLTPAEGAAFQTLLRQGTTFPALANMLAGIRVRNTFHFVGWSSGRRATLMERNNNGNTAPTYGVYFDSESREGHFLYPWNRAGRKYRKSITQGWGRMDLAGNFMEASNEPGNADHPLETVRIDLPTEAPHFHVVLYPDAEVAGL